MGEKNFVFKLYPLNQDITKRWCLDFYFDRDGSTSRGKRFIFERFKTLFEKLSEVERIKKQIGNGYKPKTHQKAVVHANTHIQRLFDVLELKRVTEKSKMSYRRHVRGKEFGTKCHLHYQIQVYNSKTKKYEGFNPTEGKGNEKSNVVDPQKWIGNLKNENMPSQLEIATPPQDNTRIQFIEQIKSLSAGSYKVENGQIVPK